jgi:hypothetical protein
MLNTCVLVQDYYRCIPFRAKCRYPQIGISTTDIVFSTRREGQAFDATGTHKTLDAVKGGSVVESGTVNAPLIENLAVVGSTVVPAELGTYSNSSGPDIQGETPKFTHRRDNDMELLPARQVLVITNLFAHRQLQFVVKNDSLYFTTDVQQSQIMPRTSHSLDGKQVPAESNGLSQSSHSIIVRPNMENLLAHQKSILKQKYVEEHLTVYNRFNPREKYTVSLRITAGHLRNFFAAPGYVPYRPFHVNTDR